VFYTCGVPNLCSWLTYRFAIGMVVWLAVWVGRMSVYASRPGMQTPAHAAFRAGAGLPRFRGPRCYAAYGSPSRR